MTITLYVSIHTQNKCFPLSKMRPLAKEKRSRTRTFRDNALNQFHRSFGLSSLRQTQTARERGPVTFQAERIFRQSITDHAAYERTAFHATGSLKKAQLHGKCFCRERHGPSASSGSRRSSNLLGGLLSLMGVRIQNIRKRDQNDRIYTWMCPCMLPIDNRAQSRFFESFMYAELESVLMP